MNGSMELGEAAELVVVAAAAAAAAAISAFMISPVLGVKLLAAECCGRGVGGIVPLEANTLAR